MRDLITRAKAIELAGEEVVNRVDTEHCSCTNRIGYNGACQDCNLTEWSASIDTIIDEDEATIVAYYYTTNEQDAIMAAAGCDGAAIDWEIAGYKIF